MVLGEERRQCGQSSESPVEVGAGGDDNRLVGRRSGQGVEEDHALGVVATQREHLLELVDDEQQLLPAFAPTRPRKLVERMLSRSDHDLSPVLGPGEGAAGKRRRETSPHDRRLAAPGRSHDTEQRRPGEAGNELSNHALTPEEGVGIANVEARQPFVGAHALDDLRVRLDASERLLEIDDAARQFGLGCPQLLTAGRGTQRSLSETPARVRPQPLGHDLVDPEWNTARLLEHGIEGQRDGRIPGNRPGQLGDRDAVEWPKLPVRSTGKRRAGRGEHECRRARDGVAGMAHGVEELIIRRVDVVDDEQHGRRYRARLGQCRRSGVAASDAAHVSHLAALRTNLPRQLGCETGLAHAPRPGDNGHVPPPVRRPFPRFA